MLKLVWKLVWDTYWEFSEDNAPLFGAALAYYTFFSMAPLLMIAIAVAGFVFGAEAARGEVAEQLKNFLGAEGATTVQSLLSRVQESEAGMTASIIGLLTLTLGATRVFTNLQTALNVMWGVSGKEITGLRANLWSFVKKRALSFAMVLAVGFLLLVSLLASAALNATNHYLSELAPAPAHMPILWLSDFLISFGGVTLLLALVYKVLPDTTIDWRDVWFGAVVTALMFMGGRLLIGWYLGNSSIGSVFGAAGSLIILLVWVYFSAQIFLFGAEMTQVFARRFGSRRSRRRVEDAPVQARA
jgi:membrane protein